MKILITGGAGFIGVNAAKYFSEKNYKVVILDNFSRKGSKSNISWLKDDLKLHPEIIEGDVRDFTFVRDAVKGVDVILHLAGQVAVTSSVLNPREDFESNALGTFNVLEAARTLSHKPIVLYSSTNKVYGGLEDIKSRETKTRYEYIDLPYGISEAQCVDFHSPYGCSKGAADQYVRDYCRIYDLPTIVLRQSCIYGPRQFGVEDQGWVAWFIIALSLGKPITIYGNGKQVRDLLYITDLLEVYNSAIEHIKTSQGQVYNIGGGMKNSLSVWYEFKPILEQLFRKQISPRFEDTRPGDQPIYISDLRKAMRELKWRPKVRLKDGIRLLHKWISENKSLFS